MVDGPYCIVIPSGEEGKKDHPTAGQFNVGVGSYRVYIKHHCMELIILPVGVERRVRSIPCELFAQAYTEINLTMKALNDN